MKRFIKSAILVLGAAIMVTSCFGEKEKVNVSLKSSSTSFTDGKAELEVVLSAASTSAVSATIVTEGSIPASAITIGDKVVIGAGETSAKIPVSVSLESLASGSYEQTFTLSSAEGAQIDASASSVKLSLVKEEEKPVVVPSVVSITSYDESFVEGAAKITLGLDKASDTDITVTLEVQDYEGYTTIPAEALSFENPVVIPAGTLTYSVPVSVDLTAIDKGVESYAVIAVASVSENATVAASGTRAFILAFTELSASQRSDWTVSFVPGIEYEGSVYDGIQVAGAGNSSYYLFVYQKGVVNDTFGGDITKYVQTMEGIVTEAMGTENAYRIKTGDETWLYQKFPVRTYEIWMLGCSEAGHLTGEYATGEFTVEASAEVVEAYNKWLGEWNVTRGSLTDTWVITEDVPGSSFNIRGIDGDSSVISDILVKADYDAESDQVVIYEQEDLKVWTYQGTDYNISLLGMYNNSQNIVSGDFDICVISKSGENTATITSAGEVTMDDGNHEITGMTFFASPTGASNGYVFNGQVFYKWPETMTKLVENNDDPVFNSYLGNWTVTRQDSEWDSAASAYVDKGEVTDVLSISAKVPGRSFNITGIEGYSDVTVEAGYNATTGHMTLKEQEITIGDMTLLLVGLFDYAGDANNPAGSYIWDNGATLFEAAISGDTINLAAGNAGSYGPFTSMQLYQYSEQSYYSFHDVGYALPNVLTRAAASSGKPSWAANAKTGATKFRITRGSAPVRAAASPVRGRYTVGDKFMRNLPLK